MVWEGMRLLAAWCPAGSHGEVAVAVECIVWAAWLVHVGAGGQWRWRCLSRGHVCVTAVLSIRLLAVLRVATERQAI